MLRRRMSSGLGVAIFVLAAAAIVVPAAARDVRIRITGNGPAATYIEEGQTVQRPVNVAIGDRITWINGGNAPHTATAENDDGDRIFDTGDIAPGQSATPIEVTQALYAAAGGAPASSVVVEYFCRRHGAMSATLTMTDATSPPTARLRRTTKDHPLTASAGGGTSLTASGTRVRRDITRLSPVELTAYRDAWRAAQANPAYMDVVQNHGCPDRFCHRLGQEITFLAWHREYLLRLEAVVGQPIHYWDWTDPQAANSGIPPAFADSTYTGGDGNLHPNPLASFAFNCDGPEVTQRFPRPATLLSAYAAGVRSSYQNSTYAAFNDALDVPHGSLHTWVRGHMVNTRAASYDPIFWAHHSNVDRQWASWQRDGGADPTPAERSLTLFGFAPKTIGDMRSISTLGYEYDRYDDTTDSTPSGPLVASGPVELTLAADDNAAGIGKTFSVPLTAAAGAADLQPSRGPLQLSVGGIPDHPEKSYFVYVFVNQPDATPEDAKPTNANFAGTFGVFGGPAVDAGHKAEKKTTRKKVLELFAGKKNVAKGPVSNVTLVVTGEGDEVLSREHIPFDSVTIGRSSPAGGGRVDGGNGGAPLTASGNPANDARRVFTGVSERGSYDDAYQKAVEQAQQRLGGGADRIIVTEVVSVTGRHGGIAGLRQLSVTIKASLEQ
ncbi:MAG: tyrosinase family protein [Planctomycetales bacterium]|nr:tyrosinase family protein [Planctomycetales bacterium]MBN8624285.1 tyrosinase family protein [Planctomycetota bacterium]